MKPTNEYIAPELRGIREINCELVILCGDSHGEWKALFKKIEHNKIENCLFCLVGDIGCGFEGGHEKDFVRYNQWFKSRNIEFIGIKGNHDYPPYFSGQYNYSHFKLLPDYTVIKINGEIWQFVGGAISVDRKYRVEGRDYWRDEIFVLDESKAVKCDVLVTHSSPPWLGPVTKSPFVQSFADRDVHLISELVDERNKIKRLYDICQPKKSYAGHFHQTFSTIYSNQKYECRGKILDILEFEEYRKTI